jgi:hypothetical protein
MLRLRICTHVTPGGTVFVNFKARRDISSAQMARAQDSRAFTLQPLPEKRGLAFRHFRSALREPLISDKFGHQNCVILRHFGKSVD